MNTLSSKAATRLAATFVWIFMCVATVFPSHKLQAGDWPQILGPNRNGAATSEKPIPMWANDGPKKKWSYSIGQGYAGPAVVGNQVIVFHRVGNVERVESLDVASGKSQWKADFDASYNGGINPDLGPRCVPLVHNNRIYAFGAAGDLYCVNLNDGKTRWTRAAYQDFGGQEGYFGAGSTPIVAGGKLLVNVGARRAGIVAFDLETGKTAWQATDEGASYSSPTSVNIDDVEHTIFVTRLNTVSVDPATGDVRFRFTFGARGPTVNGATPLVFDKDHLFVSSSYGVGANLSRINSGNAMELWANDYVMSSQYSTCVYRDGYLYGTHGREDYQNGVMRCLNAKSGKIQWTEDGFGVAHTILIRDQLLILGVDGRLRLAKATPDSYQEVATARVSDETTRALPAFSNGNLFFRDNGGQGGTLICLQLHD